MLQSDPTPEHYMEIEEWHTYYPLTGRPVTKMYSMVSDNKVQRGRAYFPVVRYQDLYHKPAEGYEFLGKFYFYESESTVLLDLGNYRVYGSKVAAGIDMYNQLEALGMTDKFTNPNIDPDELDIEPGTFLEMSVATLAHYAFGWKHVALKESLTFAELIDECMLPYYQTILPNEQENKVIPHLETTCLYPNDKAKYWGPRNIRAGYCDDWDQPLAQMCSLLNIDTLILQHELGHQESVTEVLDARKDSYNHLVSVGGYTHRPWFNNEKTSYPKIWFSDYGVIRFD